MAPARVKRGLSRKGCLSCKKLKIKCNEAVPNCEYCAHTGRRCVYPDTFQVSTVPSSGDESYSLSLGNSSAESTPPKADPYSASRSLTFQILLGSAANQLGLLRFELRMLRIFNDVCLGYITYNVNKKHVYVWNNVVPLYFHTCRLIRLAMLATGCLSLMPMLGMQRFIEHDMTGEELLGKLESVCDQFEIQQLFMDDTLFEGGQQVNLFRRSSELLSESMSEIQDSLAKLQDPDLLEGERLHHLVGASIGNSMLYSFLGLHPWKLVPLVSFPEDGTRQTDLLDVALGIKTIVIGYLDTLRASELGELFHNDELLLTPRFKIKIVEELRSQLDQYLKPYSFFEIDTETSEMINAYRSSLSMLEKVCTISVKFNYPVMLFRWLLYESQNLVKYIRSQEPFALRLLYVYLCLCVYYKFWLFECNIWKDFAVYYRTNFGPLCDFDERLYHYVVTKRKFLIDDNYRSIKDFDVWGPEFD